MLGVSRGMWPCGTVEERPFMPAKAGPNQGRLLAAVATICRAGSFFRSLFSHVDKSGRSQTAGLTG